MPRLMFACFLLGGLLPEPEPTDYCATSYCAAGLTNVGCNPPPLTGGPDCDGKNAVVVEIGQEEINYLLDKLNTLRASYASGVEGSPFPSASGMPTLQWDAELATQAGHNARRCTTRLDECHNTATYPNSGQIFAYEEFAANFVGMFSTEDLLHEAFYKIVVEKGAFINGASSYYSYSSQNEGANLANVLNDRSSKVGCAFQKWDNYGYALHYLVCNFSDNLVEGEPIYTQGEAGSDCTSSVSSKYVGLCEA